MKVVKIQPIRNGYFEMSFHYNFAADFNYA